jgi:HK97 family phage prohead protease
MTAVPVVHHRDAGTGAVALSVPAALGIDGDKRTVEGLAAVWNFPYKVTELGRTFTEVIRPGAAKESLRLRRPISQWLHGGDPAVGQAPVLALEEVADRPEGLYFRGRLLDSPQTALIAAGLAAGEITGASIRFTVPPGGDRWTDSNRHREITRMNVLEAGMVVWGMNPAATVTARTGGEPSTLSPHARRCVDLWTAGVVSLAQMPATVRAELRRLAPSRYEVMRKLDAAGMTGVGTLPQRRR